MEMQKRGWFLLVTLLVLVVAIETKKNDYDGKIPCWDKYCDDPGRRRLKCDLEKKECHKDKNGKVSCLGLLSATKPSPSKLCEQTFLMDCQCAHGGDFNWEAQCECKVSQTAKSTFGVLAFVVILIGSLGFCIARWWARKREKVVRHMIAQQNAASQGYDEYDQSQSQGRNSKSGTPYGPSAASYRPVTSGTHSSTPISHPANRSPYQVRPKISTCVKPEYPLTAGKKTTNKVHKKSTGLAPPRISVSHSHSDSSTSEGNKNLRPPSAGPAIPVPRCSTSSPGYKRKKKTQPPVSPLATPKCEEKIDSQASGGTNDIAVGGNSDKN